MNIREKYFHDFVIKNEAIQLDILSILKLPENLSKLKLIHEDTYINGITADFTLIYDDKIRAIIECKAGDIGVTDYVRGIGQVLQYEYFSESKISPKGFDYYNEFNSILLIPSSVLLNNNLNIGKFKYPKTTHIIEINDVNKVARLISKKELEDLSEIEDNNLICISQYYIRDTRLFELYMLLRYLCFLKIKKVETVNRIDVEEEMQKTESINNRNWRNVWISLSSLGFINSKNLPTESGLIFGMMEFEEFLSMMYKSYVKPYIDILMNYFSESQINKNKKLLEIKEDFLNQYSGKEILFLTQSETRYLSSWINILRDDFGCIDFQPRSTQRQIIFNPCELNDEALKEKIRFYTKSASYIKKLENIIL